VVPHGWPWSGSAGFLPGGLARRGGARFGESGGDGGFR